MIIVDCSTDRTLESIKGYHSDKIRIFSVSQTENFDMLNKGLSQATGTYVNFLFPGDYYISRESLKTMMILALQNHSPDVLYGGTLIRNHSEEVKILFRKLSLDLLKQGHQPTSLQSCWFRTACIREIGKFNSKYKLRGGFDLLCRFCLQPKFRFVSINRVVSDYDLRLVTRRMILIKFWETMKIIHHYFGAVQTLKWLFHQNDTSRFMKLWMHSFKSAFFGSK